MITRKRQRNPQSPSANNLPPKRLRRSSGANNNSIETVGDSLISQDRLSSDSYPIRAILAENSDEFLIDWEDDLITGETYSPTWVRDSSFDRASPRMNVNYASSLFFFFFSCRVRFALRANTEH